jgi:hypothetical protein
MVMKLHELELRRCNWRPEFKNGNDWNDLQLKETQSILKL